MKKTIPTDGNSPAVPFEPAEFIRWLACISASYGRPETSYLVNNAIGIGKCVLVCTMHFDAFSRACYHLEALAAENIFVYVRFFLFCFILNNVTELFTTIFLRRLSKKITCVGIIYNHFPIKVDGVVKSLIYWVVAVFQELDILYRIVSSLKNRYALYMSLFTQPSGDY